MVGTNPIDCNQGWSFIKLPQSVFLIDPVGSRHYMGYADPRFRYIQEGKFSFREICTYSFLGCGEFHQIQNGLWSNNAFSVPGQVLGLLLEIPEDQREPLFNVWKNIYRRDANLLERLGENLKSIRPFTEDGMVIVSEHDLEDDLKRQLLAHGISFVRGAINKTFEQSLQDLNLPETRVFKRLLLTAVLRRGIGSRAIQCAAILYRAYGLDRVQTFLEKNPEYFEFSWCLDERYVEDIFIPFLKGLSLQQLEHAFKNRLLEKIYERRIDVMSKFDFRGTKTGREDFWSFIKRNKISMAQFPVYLDALELGTSVFKPLEFPVKILAKTDKYLIRSPETGLELVEWGFALNNCLKTYFKTIMEENNKTWIFGIFREEKLVGAVQVGNKTSGADIRQIDINQLRTNFNKEFSQDELRDLKNLIVGACAKNRALKKHWGIKAVKKKFSEILPIDRERLIRRLENDLKGPLKLAMEEKSGKKEKLREIILAYARKLHREGVIQVQVGPEDLPEILVGMQDFFFRNRRL